MRQLFNAFHVDGTVGPFEVPNGVEVRPTFRARNDDSNSNHWTIVINKHTESILRDVISSAVCCSKSKMPEDVASFVHGSIDSNMSVLCDQYNQHGFDLVDVELSIPSQGVTVHSDELRPEHIAVSRHDVVFWHTHTPDIGSDETLHSHDVELTFLIANDNVENVPIVLLSGKMHERLQAVAHDFFGQEGYFSRVTMEGASKQLFDAVLETIPELERENAYDYLHGIGIRVIYDGSLDHPSYPVEFLTTLDNS